MRVKAPAVKLPQRQRPSRPPVPIGEGVNVFKPVMQNRRAENGGKLRGPRAPPFQQFEHLARDVVRVRGAPAEVDPENRATG